MCNANQLTGFYIMETLVVKRLRAQSPIIFFSLSFVKPKKGHEVSLGHLFEITEVGLKNFENILELHKWKAS